MREADKIWQCLVQRAFKREDAWLRLIAGFAYELAVRFALAFGSGAYVISLIGLIDACIMLSGASRCVGSIPLLEL